MRDVYRMPREEDAVGLSTVSYGKLFTLLTRRFDRVCAAKQKPLHRLLDWVAGDPAIVGLQHPETRLGAAQLAEPPTHHECRLRVQAHQYVRPPPQERKRPMQGPAQQPRGRQVTIGKAPVQFIYIPTAARLNPLVEPGLELEGAAIGQRVEALDHVG